ncbi:CBL-interacting protein kinase 21 [Platanthera zijinensis]|uniref:CBL-interacting protein kinase 21 n=1 Tax=Platanthera zijinensis TaxID=2320716 RepID=A0AAP0AT99_9ASPA
MGGGGSRWFAHLRSFIAATHYGGGTSRHSLKPVADNDESEKNELVGGDGYAVVVNSVLAQNVGLIDVLEVIALVLALILGVDWIEENHRRITTYLVADLNTFVPALFSVLKVGPVSKCNKTGFRGKTRDSREGEDKEKIEIADGQPSEIYFSAASREGFEHCCPDFSGRSSDPVEYFRHPTRGGRKLGMKQGKYELGRTLGEGNFAKVKLAKRVDTGEAFAVKILDRKRILDLKIHDQIKREIATLKLLKHPNVVRLHEEKKGRLPEQIGRKLFQQLIDGISYCHDRGVYHRDLKAALYRIGMPHYHKHMLDEKSNGDKVGPDGSNSLLETRMGSFLQLNFKNTHTPKGDRRDQLGETSKLRDQHREILPCENKPRARPLDENFYSPARSTPPD